MKLVFTGAPGAGKDTLVESINKNLNNKYTMISPGSILREEAKKETELGIYARDEYWGHGNLCPDYLINKLIEQNFSSLGSNNIIFNGFPRTVNQAAFLDDICKISAVVDLNIDKDSAIKRLLCRGRSDDDRKTIETRFLDYQEKTGPLKDYYKVKNYVRLDATRSPEEVYKQLISVLNI